MGFKLDLSPHDFLSLSGSNYLIQDEEIKYAGSIWSYTSHKTPFEQKGWNFTLDYKRYTLNKIKLSSRIEIDLGRMESEQFFNDVLIRSISSKTANWRFGLGVSKEVEDIEIVGEIFHELSNIKQKVDDWLSNPIGVRIRFEDEDRSSAWILRLGIKVSALDILDIQFGTEYTTAHTNPVTDSKMLVFNLGSSSTFNLTAGLIARMSKIIISYAFNYRNELSEYQPAHRYSSNITLMKSNPVEHRFLIRYEL